MGRLWGSDDSTCKRILDMLIVEDGLVEYLVGCSRVSCSSQAWSARWRWQWYWQFCDRDMVGCSEVDGCASSRK